jgi:predicted transposase YbfD/YdcC
MAMEPEPNLSIDRHFASLPDPRVDRTKKHLLGDILVIALCATIAGADSWPEVERFGRVKLTWLQGFLQLPNGIPSHDTFRRVFARIDPKAFNRCVAAWMAGLCVATGLRHVAIDGKAARSAKKGTFCGCLFLVNARAVENRVILGQEAVAEGTNEIGTVPELLKVLDLKGALVTLDAAGCQKEFAETIRRKGGDYLLCAKGDQEALEAAIGDVFGRAVEADFVGVEHDGHEDISPKKRHGRHEERYTTVIYDPVGLPPCWPDVAAVVLVGREREVKGERTDTAHYFLTSRRAPAAELAGLIRRHWGIENQLHWSLDVTFGEDRNRTAKGHAGTNLSLIRKVALSLLRQDPGKGSLNWKRLNAALDESYMLKALRGFPKS